MLRIKSQNKLKNQVEITKIKTETSNKNSRTNKEFIRRTREYENLDDYKNEFMKSIDVQINDYAAVTLEPDNKLKLWSTQPTDPKRKIAETHFVRQRFKKGWDKLAMFTYKKHANAFVQSYIAGYLEGRITAPELNRFVTIKDKINIEDSFWRKVITFFEDVNVNLLEKIKTLKQIEDPAEQLNWTRLLLGYAQIRGLYSGYMYEAERNNYTKIPIGRLLLIQADGELSELTKAFRVLQNNKKYDLSDKNYFKDAFGINNTDPEEIWKELVVDGRCSAFIKLLKDENGKAQDLLVGHTTWGESDEMIRMYKYNKMEFEGNDDLPFSSMTFSAYPGTLSSTDDYYITNHRLVITETTIEVVDINLYSFMKTSKTYLPNYMRVLAASRFAKTAKEWVDIFSKTNSGTYSSQWLVLDYKEFEKIKGSNTPPKNLFYMLEQIPNRIIKKDVTKYLWDKQYFGSYNRAFFDESNVDLHQALINNLYGPIIGDYKYSRRGKQFKFLEGEVKGLKSIMETMRYNGYKMNRFPGDSSNKSPASAISARYDIKDNKKLFIGGTDAKVTNYEFVKDMISIAVEGPTNDLHNPNLQPYKFADKKIPEMLDIPEIIKFPFIKIDPKTFTNKEIDDTFRWEEDRRLNLK